MRRRGRSYVAGILGERYRSVDGICRGKKELNMLEVF
jgi:hypothetical protein